MSWRAAVARRLQAEGDCLTDAIAVAIAAECDLLIVEVRAELVRLTQPKIDQIIAELMAGDAETQAATTQERKGN